jgi:hypothetical protein
MPVAENDKSFEKSGICTTYRPRPKLVRRMPSALEYIVIARSCWRLISAARTISDSSETPLPFGESGPMSSVIVAVLTSGLKAWKCFEFDVESIAN